MGWRFDADREWDFPGLPFVEKRAISIFQLRFNSEANYEVAAWSHQLVNEA
jgi:hypothetical protein